jgi:ABC-type uncharacterized transport system substrate-binding protein
MEAFHGAHLGRRTFLRYAVGLGVSAGGLAVLSSACTALSTSPLARRMIRLGYLASATREGLAPGLGGQALSQAFIDGLTELGWVEGQNLAIDWRSSDGYVERFAGLAAELVAVPVDIIFVGAGTPAARPAKQATSNNPIVAVMQNPVQDGLVKSLAHPGGNVTGTTQSSSDLAGKRLSLLRELLPGLTSVAFLANPDNPTRDADITELQVAAQTLGLQLHVLWARAVADIPPAIASTTNNGDRALLYPSEPVFATSAGLMMQLAIRERLPVLAYNSGAVDVGALMSYGPDYRVLYGRCAYYVDRILRGASPADLPVEGPTKFVMQINVKTAEALGLSSPPALAAQVTQWVQ